MQRINRILFIKILILVFSMSFTGCMVESNSKVKMIPVIVEEPKKPEPTKRLMKVEATAYTAGKESTGKTPDHPAYGITKSGLYVVEGRTIAVDPRLIPLGTEVDIYYQGNHLGTFIAEDTGRLIRGKIIDIYIEDLERAKEWGRREVIITYDPVGNNAIQSGSYRAYEETKVRWQDMARNY